MADSEPTVSIKLTQSEAVVLFDFLWRFSRTDKLTIADQSEQRVLWDMCCALESELVEPFRPEWDALLEAARGRVRDPGDEGEGA